MNITETKNSTTLEEHKTHLAQLQDMKLHYPDLIPCMNIAIAHIKSHIRTFKSENFYNRLQTKN